MKNDLIKHDACKLKIRMKKKTFFIVFCIWKDTYINNCFGYNVNFILEYRQLKKNNQIISTCNKLGKIEVINY